MEQPPATRPGGSQKTEDAGQHARPVAVLVLGMHRSGTSALTRVLSLLGAALPDRLIPATASNQAGFWESQDIQQLNDRLLAALGLHWDDWRPPQWPRLDAQRRRELHEEALGLLRRDFHDAPLWALKDPRICRLMPFWRQVLSDFGADIRCVLPLRDPDEVAASLQQRNDFSADKGRLLWLGHVLAAERESRDLPRCFVTYDALLSDWSSTMSHIAQHLHLRFPHPTDAAALEIETFLRRDLRHHALAPAFGQAAPGVAAWIEEAVTALPSLLVAADDADTLRRLDRLHGEFDRAGEALAPVFAEQREAHAAALQRSDEERDRLHGALDDTRASLKREQAAHGNARQRIAGLEQQLQEQREEAAARASRLQRGVDFLRNQLAARDSALEAARMRTAEQWAERLRAVRQLHATRWHPPWLRRPRRTAGARDDRIRVPRRLPPLRLYGLGPAPRSYLRMLRQAFRLRHSGLFDAEWYLLRYPDIALGGAHPLWHWLTVGWREGRMPNPIFDPRWYLERYRDVAEAGLNPLLHYLEAAPAERRQPGPLFHPDWYLAAYPDVAKAGVNPLSHYLLHGMSDGRAPGPDFDPGWYVEAYPDVAHSGLWPLWHFVLSGRSEGRRGTRPDAADGTASQTPPSAPPLERLDPQSEAGLQLQVDDAAVAQARDSVRDADIGQFSIVMPTWNRAAVITRAIDSVLAQSWADWELIVCDDGSSDDTAQMLHARYATEIARGRIRYLALPRGGVCAARNAGLRAARGRWIAYLDSDNAWHPHYLLMMAAAFATDPQRRTAYACVHVRDERSASEFIRCASFDWRRLLARNYIDLNIFVHHRELYEQLGGFDESLSRLVDWDLILRYTQQHEPAFVRYALCDYYIAPSLKNITLTETLASNEAAIRRKYSETPQAEAAPPPKAVVAAAPYRDFEEYQRRALFMLELRAPFSEEAKRVIGHMRAVHRHLSALAAATGDATLISVSLHCDATAADATEAAARSVLAQGHDHLELLLTGDGTAARLAQSLKDERVRHVTTSDTAPAAARNTALAQARGDFVMFLDAQDRLLPDCLHVLAGELRRHPQQAFVYCAQGLRQPGSGDSEGRRSPADDTGGVEATLDAIHYAPFSRALLENRSFIRLGAALLRRAELQRLEGFDASLPVLADWELLLRASQDAAALAVPCLLSLREDAGTERIPEPLRLQAMQHIDTQLAAETLAARLPDHDVPGLAAMHAPRAPVEVSNVPGISVVIPSFECLDYLRLCVDSVRRFTRTPFELIVVDNASSRAVRRYLAELAREDGIRVIQNETNYGFTYAVNQGIAAAEATHDVVLLNNDAVVTPGWDAALQQVFADVPDAGLAVSRQVLLPGTKTVLTHSPASDPSREVDVNLSLHHDNVLGPLPGPQGYFELSFAPFFCVYIPRRTLQAVGPLDHVSGPHYRSDRLYCEAVRRIAGQRIVYTPHAKLYHFLQQATSALRSSDQAGFQSMFVRNEWTAISDAASGKR